MNSATSDLQAPAPVIWQPHPEHPGWHEWRMREPGRFNDVLGPMLIRTEGPTAAVVRLANPGASLSNSDGAIHGGALLAFADIALFAGAFLCGVEQGYDAVTLDLNMQFVSSASIGQPLDAVVEVLRETRKMAFLRALIQQAGETRCAVSATIRKPPSRR